MSTVAQPADNGEHPDLDAAAEQALAAHRARTLDRTRRLATIATLPEPERGPAYQRFAAELIGDGTTWIGGLGLTLGPDGTVHLRTLEPLTVLTAQQASQAITALLTLTCTATAVTP